MKNQLAFLGMEDATPEFTKKRPDQFEPEICSDIHWRSSLFLMRPIMMRHSQLQTYRGTTTTLMSLPPKVSVFSKISVRPLPTHGVETQSLNFLTH
jgi:hypothetical protein